VIERTRELLSLLLERNEVEHDQLVSIIFTSTKDLRSAFPALAARELGLGDVPLLCAGELDVVGGQPEHDPVLLHCYSTRPRAQSAPRLPAPRQAPARRPPRSETDDLDPGMAAAARGRRHRAARASVGLAARAAGVAEVVGADNDRRELRDALEREAITSRARSVEEAAEGADLIVAATPVRSLAGVLARAHAANPDAVLTDVGSTEASPSS
jgi:chorismate mutase